MRLHPALLPALLLSACTPPPDQEPSTQVDAAAELNALAAAAESYHRAASAKDRDAVVALYADDAMMIPPDADRVQGIEGVRNYRFGFIESPSAEVAFELVNVVVSDAGDMGWTLGIANASFTTADGQRGRDRVRDFHVWTKVDGEWKVAVDVWNSSPPSSDE